MRSINGKKLYEAIKNTGATVQLIEPVMGLPDMVFTANAGLTYKNKIWIANFRAPERREESLYFKKWFQKEKFTIINDESDYKKSPYFKGAGDALFLGKKLIAGYGQRS